MSDAQYKKVLDAIMLAVPKGWVTDPGSDRMAREMIEFCKRLSLEATVLLSLPKEKGGKK